GGYEVACAPVADSLRRRGHQIAVLTSNYGLGQRRVDEEGVLRLLHYGSNAPGLLKLACKQFADHRTLRKVLSSWNPDVVYGWSLLCLFPLLHLALRDAGVPAVLNIQDVWLSRQLAEADQQRSLWYEPARHPAKRVGKVLVRQVFRWLYPAWLHPLRADDLPVYNIVACSRFRMAEHQQL